MSKLIDRITGVDTGKYRVEETKDDQRRRQNQENQYTPNKEKDKFDKKGAADWKKILPDSRQTLRTGTFRNRDEISFNRIEVSEISRVVRKAHWSNRYLIALGIMTRRGKIRVSVAVAYGLLLGMIGTVSIFILRIVLF